MAPGSLRRTMKQVRAIKNVLHKGQPRKAGHIFKVPDDMDLETARRLLSKGIVTDCIEVLDEPAGEASTDEGHDHGDPGDVQESEGTDEPGEEVTELGDDTPEDDGCETDDDSCATEKCDFYNDGMCGDEDGPQKCESRTQPVDINTLTKAQIKDELKERMVGYSNKDSKDVLKEKLLKAIEAENVDGTEAGAEAGADDAGEG